MSPPPEIQADDLEGALLIALVLGLVEGVTEFLPVSSTGHLIVAGHLVGGHDSNLEVGMQVGAISAIVLLYWRRLWDALGDLGRRAPGRPNLLVAIVLAAAPAALLGLLLDDWLDAHLFRPAVVACALVLGGLLLWWLESWYRRRPASGADLAQLTPARALGIGAFQCLALVPGTSRSGATLAGGMLLGLSRTAAAEFSFLVGIPILYGACSLRLWKHWDAMTGPLLVPLLVATLVSFLSALVVVRPFVRFLRGHTLVPFAVYRIVAGGVLAVLCLRGVV